MERFTQNYTEGEANNSTYVFIMVSAEPQTLDGTKLEIPPFTLFPDCMLNSLTRPSERGEAQRRSTVGRERAERNIWSARTGTKFGIIIVFQH